MGKLTKRQTSMHDAAVELINSNNALTFDEKRFILENYDPRANHNITKDAVYFTPWSIAHEMMVETIDGGDKRVLDIGAGIGMLSFHTFQKANYLRDNNIRIVCLDKNPEFCRIGRRILPEAEWICGDMYDETLIKSLGRFDEVISNPPYGLYPKMNWLRAKSSQYAAAEVAMKVAPHAVFLLAQSDCPFKYTATNGFKRVRLDRYELFLQRTGIEIGNNCGLDLAHCETYKDWPGINFEIALISMSEDIATHTSKKPKKQVQLNLFEIEKAA